MYSFYELRCPACKNRFVYMKGTYKGPIYKVYKRKGHKEALESTNCPKCNIEVAIIEDSLAAIDIRDESIELAGIERGI